MTDSADLLAGLDPDRLLALSLKHCDIAGGTSTADVARPERSSIALSAVLASLVDDDSAWTAEVPVRHVAAIASAVVGVLDRAGLLT